MFQFSVFNGVLSKTSVCEPVVQCPHPAAHGASMEGFQAMDGGDVVVLCPYDFIVF